MMSANGVLRGLRKEEEERKQQQRLKDFRGELRQLKEIVQDVETLDFDMIRFQQRPQSATPEYEAEVGTEAGSDPETEPNSTNTDAGKYDFSAAAIQQKADEESAPLAQQDRTILKTAFDRVDGDGSGVISMTEMTEFLSQLGWDLTAQQAFTFLDKDESDSLTFEEFLRWKGFAWQHKVALVRRKSSRSFGEQSNLDLIAEDEDEDISPVADAEPLNEEVGAQTENDDEDENVAELCSRVKTLRDHLDLLHELYDDLLEVRSPTLLRRWTMLAMGQRMWRDKCCGRGGGGKTGY